MTKSPTLEQIKLLKQEIELLKRALCTCPHDGKIISCPIHGEKMYGNGWWIVNHLQNL